MSNITVSLPDGSVRELADDATALDLAAAIGSGLKKAAVAAVVDGTETDLTVALHDGATVSIITAGTPEGRHVLRHSTAHVMAQAVTRLFPGAKFSIGPAIENGFYYDFELPGGATFSDDDLERIEAEMREIIKANQPFMRSEMSMAEAKDLVRRPAVQGRDHRARRIGGGRQRRCGRSRRGRRDQRLPQHRLVRRHVRRPPRAVHRQAGLLQAAAGVRAPTGAATRRARCCSASTARRGSRSRRSPNTSTSWRRPPSATTASSPPNSTC